MGVCLEICIGYERAGASGLNFTVDTLFDIDKELSPIYEDIWNLDCLGMDIVHFPHAEEGKTQDSYGDSFKTYTVKQILEVIESNIAKLSEIPEKVYGVNGDRKGIYKDSRWYDSRVQGIIAYLKYVNGNQKILLSWS